MADFGPTASSASFVCSISSCLGNRGSQGQLDNYDGYYDSAESPMVIVQPGARLDIRDSSLWKQGQTRYAPWLNDYGYNAALDVVC